MREQLVYIPNLSAGSIATTTWGIAQQECKTDKEAQELFDRLLKKAEEIKGE
jgi:hypothetical protein